MVRMRGGRAPWALGLILGTGLTAGHGVRAEAVALARLESGQRVEATFSTWGCFGYRSKYRLVFAPDLSRPGGAVVEIRNVKWLRNKTIAKRTLSPSELDALDLGLSEYRRFRRGGCISTNLNQVRLRLVRDGEVVTEEMYHGNTCNVHMVQGALDLEDLIYRPTEDKSDLSHARHNLRLQATVGGGLPVDPNRPRSPTAPEPRRYAD